MITLASRLETALRGAGLAVTGVSVGEASDRASWLVHPRDLQAQAKPIIDAFVLPTPAQELDEQAMSEVDEKKLRAIVMGIYECWPNPLFTRSQLRNRIIAIYKTL